MTERVATLIMAGGKNKPEMQAACGGLENRALVPLRGRPMLDYVVEAVRDGLGEASRILIAGDVPTPSGCVAVPGGTSLVDTLLNGASALEADETRLLIVTADIPFLTGASVQDFLQRARALPDAPQVVWPIIEAERCRERFPKMRRTTLRVAEGTFTGGNLALVDPAFLRRSETLLRDAYARRKSVIGLARLAGPGLLLRLLVSRIAPGLLPIAVAEAAFGRALGGVSVRALVSPFPEIGADVDRPEDISLAERYLQTAPVDAGSDTSL